MITEGADTAQLELAPVVAVVALIALAAALWAWWQARRAFLRQERILSDLRLSMEVYRQTFDYASLGICHLNTEGRYTVGNRAVCDLFGYSREEFVTRHLFDLVHPDDRTIVEKAFAGIISGKLPLVKGERRFVTKQGQIVWVSVSSTPVLNSSGEIRYLMTIYENISQRKETERIIAEQQQQIIASSKMSALGEMAGGIAHEINNPIAIIDGRVRNALKLLAKTPPEVDRARPFLEEVGATVARVTRIVKGLRNFARTGEHDPFTVESLAHIIGDVLPFCAERFRTRGIELTVAEVPPSLSIECRPTEIGQVLVNLLSNAFDAIEARPERWVKVTFNDLGSEVELVVTDSGPGISEAVSAKIMQPFFTTKELGKGTGLGLSVSSGICSAHGGKLSYDPKSPSTRFVVTLPKQQKIGATNASLA